MSDVRARTNRLRDLAIGIALAVTGVLFCCVFDPLGLICSREAARRVECKNHLHQIAIALHNYHEVFGCFPPAYIADSTGRPMHSWRVLILPFLDNPSIYRRYRFDEPWDGPNNSKLAAEVPYVFRCPTAHDDPEHMKVWTDYVAIIGPHTGWQGERPVEISEFTDGLTNTLQVVEIRNSGIHWMEPRDLHVTQMATTINSRGGQGISSAHEGGAHVLFGDGRARYLSEKVSAEEVRRLCERDDGEGLEGEY